MSRLFPIELKYSLSWQKSGEKPCLCNTQNDIYGVIWLWWKLFI